MSSMPKLFKVSILARDDSNPAVASYPYYSRFGDDMLATQVRRYDTEKGVPATGWPEGTVVPVVP